MKSFFTAVNFGRSCNSWTFQMFNWYASSSVISLVSSSCSSVLSTQFTFFCWQTLARWPIFLQLLHFVFKVLRSFMCLVLNSESHLLQFLWVFVVFVSNSLIRISTSFIYFATRYLFFSCSSALIFHSFLTKLGKIPIFNHSFFANVFVCCSGNYLATNRIFLSTIVSVAFAKGTCLPSNLDSITESARSFAFDLN